MFKKSSKVENIHTNERRKIVAVDTVTVKQDPFTQVTVYVLDDGDRWVEDLLCEHWREVEK